MIEYATFYGDEEIKENTFSISKFKFLEPRDAVSAYEKAANWRLKNRNKIKIIGITATLPNLNFDNTCVCVFYERIKSQ